MDSRFVRHEMHPLPSGGRRLAWIRSSRCRFSRRPVLETLEGRTLLSVATDPFLITPISDNAPVAMHIHARLTVLVDGQPMVIPAGIGMGPDGDLPIHTHDDTGVIHVESTVVRGFHLRDFFTVWGLSSPGQGSAGPVPDSKLALSMTVNGAPSSEFGAMLLQDHQDIVIREDTVGATQAAPTPPSGVGGSGTTGSPFVPVVNLAAPGPDVIIINGLRLYCAACLCYCGPPAPVPGTLQFTLATSSVGEGDGVATIQVSRSAGVDGAVSVRYDTIAGGSAVEGLQYTGAHGTLTFPDGNAATQSFQVPILQDNRFDPNSTVKLQLSDPAGGASLGTSLETLTIVNIDSPPSVSVGNATISDGMAVFPVTLSAASGVDATVSYSTSDGTALSASDYAATSGQLIIPAGATTGQIVVPVVLDPLFDDPEQFFVNLFSPSNATVGQGQASATIVTSAAPPTLSIGAASVADGAAVFTVTLSAPSGADTSMSYATSNGTATAGADYQTVSGTLTIPAGATSVQILVPVVVDTRFEDSESFSVNIFSPSNATVTQGKGSAMILPPVPPPSLSISDATVLPTTAAFTVTLSAPSGVDTTVNYATSDGSATGFGDYRATSGTLTIPAGATSAQVVVTLVSDGLFEETESFSLDLSSPSNATIARGHVAANVFSFVDPPGLLIGPGVVSGGSAVFTVTLTAPSGVVTTVNYGTSDGSAKVSSDYRAVTGTLTIPAGATSAQIVVPIVPNSGFKPAKSFALDLSSSSNASIARGHATVTIPGSDLPTPSLPRTVVIGHHKPKKNNPRRPYVAGLATAGASVDLIDESGAVLGSSAATASGTYLIAPSRPLGPGHHLLRVRMGGLVSPGLDITSPGHVAAKLHARSRFVR